MTKTVIMDIDETMVHTTELDYDRFDSLLRPGTVEFLQHCKNKGYKLIALTIGVVPFQEEVLTYHKIRDFFSGIYGWGDLYRTFTVLPPLPLEGKFVLVDNAVDPWRLGQKCNWMQTQFRKDNKNFVHVEDFYGVGTAKPLTDYLPILEELLA